MSFAPEVDTTDPHLPVLVSEVIALLFPQGPRAGGVYCDATVGMGGHARAILLATGPDGRLIGLDRDGDALAVAREVLAPFESRVTLVHSPFSRIRSVLRELGVVGLDGALVDLGVSSPQLDRGERGFSFRASGPLDMRMDQTAGETAAELLARITEAELVRILRDYGEERFAGRIARRVVEARDRGELLTTSDLAALVARAVPGHERHKNPATRTFQALRIVVNGELAELDQFLDGIAACLRPGGRVGVISFHSLEDRMVKRRFRAWAMPPSEDRGRADAGSPPGLALGVDGAPSAEAPRAPRFCIVTNRIVTASEEEQAKNPRARSAKLRVAERVH